MAEIRPFPAVRPRPEVASSVASVPYDVVDTQEARELAAGNPMSFLHVLRAEIDLPEGTDPHADEVYARAAANYRLLRDEGALVRDDEVGLFVYRIASRDHSQVGIVGRCSLDEYERDLIKKHERTRPEKENDRVRHILETGIQAGPVFLTYRGRPEIDRAVEEIVTTREPLYDLTVDDGVRHTIWRAPDAGLLMRQFRAVPALYVADGHHRSASAARARAERRDRNPDHTGTEAYNFFLTVSFPADHVRILPYNRVVTDLGGKSPEVLLERLRETFTVEANASPSPDRPGTFSIYLAGRWHRLEAPAELTGGDDPVESLDAAILQRQVLEPLLGIEDPRTSERIEFVGGVRGTDALARKVDRRGDGAAFSMFPVSVDQLMAVADAGRVLPPKSTWFAPKLRSGLLIHEI